MSVSGRAGVTQWKGQQGVISKGSTSKSTHAKGRGGASMSVGKGTSKGVDKTRVKELNARVKAMEQSFGALKVWGQKVTGQGGEAGNAYSPKAIWRLDFELARQGCLGPRGAPCTLFTLLWRLRAGVKHQYWARKAGMGDRPPDPPLYEQGQGSGLRTLSQYNKHLHANRDSSARKIYECHRGCLCPNDCLNRAAGLQGELRARHVPKLAASLVV